MPQKKLVGTKAGGCHGGGVREADVGQDEGEVVNEDGALEKSQQRGLRSRVRSGLAVSREPTAGCGCFGRSEEVVNEKIRGKCVG